jgi:hypothetical protein
MNGLEIMLKSMGIDTEKIKELLNPEVIRGIIGKVEALDSRLANIEQSLIRVETKLETLPTEVAFKYLAENEVEMIAEMRRLYGGTGTDTRDSNDGDRNASN